MTKLDNYLYANWNYPTNIKFGWGRISEIVEVCEQLEMSAPLLVTDSGLGNHPITQRCLQQFAKQSIKANIFYDVNSNPTTQNVENGVLAYKHCQANGVIAFGGGSALDAGKAIALMVGQDRPILDFEDIADNWLKVNPDGMARCVAIPTTAGTGSEVGRAAVIIDELSSSKKIIFHPQMMPDLVLADPELSVGLPKHITAATGIDAFVHNFEAYCAPSYHPMADGIALQAMQAIKSFLPLAYSEPKHQQARSEMLAAAMMGATAFQKGLGAIHALAHPLGGFYRLHHGLLNAVLLPYIVIRNKPAIETKLVHLSSILQLEYTHFDAFLNWILEFRRNLGIPHTLAEIGVPKSALDDIAEPAFQDPSNTSNPIKLNIADYQKLIEHAYFGTLF